MVEEWKASGLSKRQFAARHGMKAGTLGWWAWNLGRSTPAFLEVVVEEPEPRPERPPEFVVELARLRVRVACGFDAGELRRLVHALC